MMNPFPDPFTTGPQFTVSSRRWQGRITRFCFLPGRLWGQEAQRLGSVLLEVEFTENIENEPY